MYYVVSCKECDMKLPPRELKGRGKAVERTEHGKRLLVKEQGNRKAAAQQKQHIRRDTGQWRETGNAISVFPRMPHQSPLMTQ